MSVPPPLSVGGVVLSVPPPASVGVVESSPLEEEHATANTNADALTTAGGARERLATADMSCQLPVANGFTQRVSLLAATVAVTVRVVDAAGTMPPRCPVTRRYR